MTRMMRYTRQVCIRPGECKVRGMKPFLLLPSRRLLQPGGETAYTRQGSFQQLKGPHSEPRALSKPVSEGSRGNSSK